MEFKIIEKTAIYGALSDLGKRIFLPDGIFYWSGRAKKEAELIGTIGSAFGTEKDFIAGGSSEWVPCYVKEIMEYSNMSVKQVVPYAPIGGLPDLRETWKEWIIKKSNYDGATQGDEIKNLKKLITKPLVTNGITNGIFLCCSLLLTPGEVIISPNKRWGNYDNIMKKNIGARIKSFEFFKEQKINLQGLKDAIMDVSKSQDKIVIILNFPNNPTGYVPTEQEAQDIVELLKVSQQAIKKPIVVLVDDAYEPYVYNEEALSRSLFYALLELEEDVIPIKLDGISKELLAYGGRIGFVTIGLKSSWVKNDEELEVLKAEINNKLEGINRSTISNCNHFYQAITLKMFAEKGMDEIIGTRKNVWFLLKKRYEKINAELSRIENADINVDPNSGGFFLFLNLNPEKIKSIDFADILLKKYKVGVIPIYKPEENINGIRIAYCSIDLEKIPEFIKRINSALIEI